MYLLLLLVLVLASGIYVFMQQPPFGKMPEGDRLERIKKSPNYRDGAFQNPVPTPDLSEDASYFSVLYDFIFRKDKRGVPSQPLPVVKQDLSKLTDLDKPQVIWFGHSSYLIRIAGKTILVDPVFSERTSPSQLFGTKRFPGTDAYLAHDMPKADIVVFTHDHYDHLDFDFATNWIPANAKIVTSLGVGAHLESWKIPAERITELDWWESSAPLGGFKFTAVPARHFSGRGFKRGQALWSGFVLEAEGYKILLGGDSGYSPHFKQIGDKMGPFNLVILECGQYNAAWKYIHMFPEETVQAAQDLRTETLMPVHWGKFELGLHAWDDPIKRVTKEASIQNLKITTPRIGETVVIDSLYPAQKWWEGLQ